MTFNDFINHVDIYFTEHKQQGIRYGQSIMNTLFLVWPSKYQEISTTDDDCFYDDSVCRFTLNRLEREWAGQIILP